MKKSLKMEKEQKQMKNNIKHTFFMGICTARIYQYFNDDSSAIVRNWRRDNNGDN